MHLRIFKRSKEFQWKCTTKQSENGQKVKSWDVQIDSEPHHSNNLKKKIFSNWPNRRFAKCTIGESETRFTFRIIAIQFVMCNPTKILREGPLVVTIMLYFPSFFKTFKIIFIEAPLVCIIGHLQSLSTYTRILKTQTAFDN